MNETIRFQLELYAKLLRALLASKSRDARTIAKLWLDIVEDELKKEDAGAQLSALLSETEHEDARI